MTATLNQDDIKLLKSVFATKSDLKKEIKNSEKRVIRRMDFVDKKLDREHLKVVKDVDAIKAHLGLSFSST